MCSMPKTPPPPKPPVEYANQRQPDQAAADAMGQRTRDQMRSRSPTILTSGSGVSTRAPTAMKTLLGQ